MSQSPESTQEQFFHRPELAAALADQALDTSLGSSGGMFLAAPRRTGKSTFVRQDLVPEFERRNLNVIYVDLWIDKTVNPAIHIASAIRTELAREDGAVANALKKLSKLSRLTVGAWGHGLSFDLSQLNLSKDATLADALKALSKASQKKLILVIDEAQHALTTDEGINALFSLKAARDSLNTDQGQYGMQLIATGSNRDKLATLVNGREQAFYGADMVQFPTLGKDYVQWLVGRSKLHLDNDLATDVFQSLGSRPEPFRKALSQTRLQLALNPAQDSDAMLASLAAKGVRDSRTDFLNTVASLPPLQSALLRELAADSLLGPDVRRPGLFSAAMKARLLARLADEMGADHGVSVETPSVQNALDKLREANFLWRSQRGSYSVEDEQFLEWLAQDKDLNGIQ
ncbi:MAG: ATP-binding protein [Gammaproteobacteria bacterium]|uniref:ATP-binding protein n=1 Tax=Rhodoferax sp. TaxID=50421 RepID=UPI0017D4D13A|nr:ATP-binding protein [Rhodoferax sp.]MBU3897675.1 ATP-binding protein [Gammaproteobacteria bacterium]MBA3056315.1 ATP-binding protein [Rhodoferax sp.]MBU3998584.1 ATP-binding protein [Gammaproteobacteria bacterium]MBU4080051.1 ATP-binding protein [Gammaproteobacteria bacterium]MBU4112170.1 ATP-binding protein [Gammaproteobacteria bacterium]